MKLIINKQLDNINDSVNIKIIEITSTDFLDNDLDYFVYKNQIPLIKFTDTEEIFNIKNFKNNLNSSLAETLIIIDETDLELLSNGSGGGGSQDLQSVMDNGEKYVHIGDTTSALGFNVAQPADVYLFNGLNGFTANPDTFQFTAGKEIDVTHTVFRGDVVEGKIFDFSLPTEKPSGDYKLATIDDIPTSPISGTFANPTSITVVNGLITAIS